MRMLSSLNFKSYKDLFEITFTDCAIRAEESSLEILVKWMVTHYNTTLAIITSARTGLLTIISIFRGYFSFWKCLLFAILLIAMSLYFVWFNPIALIEYMKPINHTISGGDWQTLVCYLNKLTLTKIDNRPILIIKELHGMNDETMFECLRAFEKVKQENILFPAILETSDNKWNMVPAIKRSRSSFSLYYIEEMTYDEGLIEIVNRLKLFTKDYVPTMQSHTNT